MNIDTLFLSGRIDDATYVRYLREFERQQRHGKGHKAYATVVDGILYYTMSDKEDYFYGGMPFEDCCLHHPFEEVCGLAASMLPLPDIWLNDDAAPPPDSPFDESLDDYLKRLEECPQDTL